ncbi:putative Zn-dependent protease with MMP-like domain [Sphingomonas jejuensis]|uniref:Zn-dependent protease with MMP-like domain n=1 Tax=Sphingomonas jejuensis TaxID=904715 RepID=A0ABX0XNP0_9SPHN|nr:metallopeptidase family protein [Sphingomonas jejuensis]NJC34823.1 putative Zn-dependent protease with MMP-like domain [Sphingomonas jejuensis]
MPGTIPPSADDIEAIALATLLSLPPLFGDHLGDVVLRVEEFATEDVLDELAIDDPFALTGLYTGRPIGEKTSGDTGALPDMIHLYRRPILDEWIERDIPLETLVSHVLIHEVGHHFGLSDEDMDALEQEAADAER